MFAHTVTLKEAKGKIAINCKNAFISRSELNLTVEVMSELFIETSNILALKGNCERFSQFNSKFYDVFLKHEWNVEVPIGNPVVLSDDMTNNILMTLNNVRKNTSFYELRISANITETKTITTTNLILEKYTAKFSILKSRHVHVGNDGNLTADLIDSYSLVVRFGFCKIKECHMRSLNVVGHTTLTIL